MSGHTRAADSLSYVTKVAILVAVAVLAVVIMLFVPPIAQNPAYHQFADQRSFSGIANFADTVSNLAFLVIGAMGIAFVFGKQGEALFDIPGERWPYFIFFVGVTFVSFGSAYYHLDPTTETLFWDRLPMTVAFMALFAAFVTDRVHSRIGITVFLPLLLAISFAAVIYWRVTESAGQGDLRAYGLVQFYPMLAIPLICWFFPGRHTSGRVCCLHGLLVRARESVRAFR